MKRALAGLLLAQSCQAQWVDFEPCGREIVDLDDLGPDLEFKAEYIYSPNIAKFRFRAEKISVILEPKGSETTPIKGIKCVEVQIEGEPFLVVGTPDEITDKINKALEAR